MIESKLNGESLDILNENITKLKELFPEIVTEDKIDFDKFKQIFGNYIEESNERYNFTWHGKSKAIAEAQKPSTGTLRPVKEESKNWETTENLYIEGDNLEVLKLLQKSYYNKVKMIYIDPPYNTGKDFVYSDNYKDNLENYLEMTGQVAPRSSGERERERESIGIKLSTNTETSGRFHTSWINMMYPRLKLARNLLTDDGVIFISIDDNEESNLRKLCDEIFGEENFQSCISWRRRSNQPNDASKMIAKVTEYILVYSKSKDILREKKSFGTVDLSEERLNSYTNSDNDPKGEWTTTPWCASRGQGGCNYNITTPTGKNYNETWLGTQDTFNKLVNDNRIIFTNKGDGKPRKKVYKSEAINKGQAAIDFWVGTKFGDNLSATSEIKNLFGENRIFDYPKPVNLLKTLIRISCIEKECIILDFFSGSGTIAESTIRFNSDNNKSLKYISVQIPEVVDEKSEAFKAGYKTIAEIGKERIRRAGDKILKESNNKELDIGFKVFKLDSSNLNKWNPDYNNLEKTLIDSSENLVEGRTELDLIYEIMIKYGIDLTLPIEEFEIENKKIYSIGFGSLLICLDDKITKEIAMKIVELKEKLSPETVRIVFKDNGFESDSDKTNIKETLKNNSIDEFITI